MVNQKFVFCQVGPNESILADVCLVDFLFFILFISFTQHTNKEFKRWRAAQLSQSDLCFEDSNANLQHHVNDIRAFKALP